MFRFVFQRFHFVSLVLGRRSSLGCGDEDVELERDEAPDDDVGDRSREPQSLGPAGARGKETHQPIPGVTLLDAIMLIWAVVQWLLLVAFAVIFMFIAEIGLAVVLALLGRASDKFESAIAFALILCTAAGYVAGRAGVPAIFRLNWGKPLSLPWFVVAAFLVTAIAFAAEISGKERRTTRGFTTQLNGWQRLWVAMAVVLLVPAILVVANATRSEDEAVVQDLQNPRCRDASALAAASYHEPCNGLAIFNNVNTPVKDVEQYRAAIDRERAKVAGGAFLTWCAICTILYTAGVGIAWIRAGFRRAT